MLDMQWNRYWQLSHLQCSWSTEMFHQANSGVVCYVHIVYHVFIVLVYKEPTCIICDPVCKPDKYILITFGLAEEFLFVYL